MNDKGECVFARCIRSARHHDYAIKIRLGRFNGHEFYSLWIMAKHGQTLESNDSHYAYTRHLPFRTAIFPLN